MVAAFVVEKGAEAHAQDGRYRRVEERRPVATELDAEAAAGKSRRHSHLPIGVIPLLSLDLVEFRLVPIQCIILHNGPPRQLADGRNGVHIDTVPLTTLELYEGMVVVAEVHHEHSVVHEDVEILLGKAQESRRPLHVAEDAGRVGRAFHKQPPRLEQQVELAAQLQFGGSL